jgi:hypothetical protein
MTADEMELEVALLNAVAGRIKLLSADLTKCSARLAQAREEIIALGLLLDSDRKDAHTSTNV